MSMIEEAVPGHSALAEMPDDGIHFTTFGAALGVGFLLSMLLPVVPIAVLLVAAWA